MKHLKDLQVRAVDLLRPGYAVLRLTDKEVFPEMQPGQFVEIRVDGSPETFLRRPISINFVATSYGYWFTLWAKAQKFSQRCVKATS